MAREITGRKVLAITVGAFGVIIGVNLIMAFQAVSTFPGLEVKNSYVASQNFDRERTAQQQLGWVVTPSYDGAQLHLRITDAAGQPVRVRNLSATIGRPTHVRDDVTPEFRWIRGEYLADVVLEPGLWNIHLTAESQDGTPFRQRLDHYEGSRVN